MYATIDEVFSELKKVETPTIENLLRWSEAVRTCQSALQLIDIYMLLVSMKQMPITQSYGELMATGFEAGRLWGRSEVLAELGKPE